MLESILSAFNTLFSFIQKLSPILIAILSSSLTFLYTKLNTTNAKKLSVQQEQLEKFYFPVYRLLQQDMDKKITKEKASDYAKIIFEIAEKYYILVFPEHHKIIRMLYLDASCDDAYQETFKTLCRQITYEYEFLKKRLGYPSMNRFELFKRMTLKQKAIAVLYKIYDVLILVFGFLYFTQEDFLFCLLFVSVILIRLTRR